MRFNTFIATTGDGLARATHNGGDSWSVEQRLAGQDIRALAADPHNPDRLYAGTAQDGVLRSDDRGASWRPVGLAGHAIRAIAASPTEPDTVYAGTKPPALYISRDGGASWRELEALRAKRRPWWFSPAEWPPTPYVQTLALSPTDPGVILVGIELGALLRSGDGGATFSDHRPGAVRDCHTVTFHPTNGDWAYVGGGDGAAFSQDAGQTWTKPQRVDLSSVWMQVSGSGKRDPAEPGGGLDRFYGWAVAGDPAQPDTWYFSAAPGPAQAHGHNGNAQAHIFRHRDADGWQALAGGLPQPLGYMPYTLITDAGAPGHIYAGLDNGDIWHSDDHGERWVQLPVKLATIHRVLLALK